MNPILDSLLLNCLFNSFFQGPVSINEYNNRLLSCLIPLQQVIYTIADSLLLVGKKSAGMLMLMPLVLLGGIPLHFLFFGWLRWAEEAVQYLFCCSFPGSKAAA
jgi:hypothetical protein